MRPSAARAPSPLALAIAIAALAAASVGGCASKQQQQWTTPAELAQRPGSDVPLAESLASQAQRAEDEGRIDLAIDLYRQSVVAYREFPAAWNNLGRLLMMQGDGLEAATAFRVAADLSPRDPRPVYNLGMLWQDRGYMEDASRFFAQALERDESYLPALRESVYVDRHERNIINEHVARRIRRALLIETDPSWRTFFEREKIRVEQEPGSSAGALAR